MGERNFVPVYHGGPAVAKKAARNRRAVWSGAKLDQADALRSSSPGADKPMGGLRGQRVDR